MVPQVFSLCHAHSICPVLQIDLIICLADGYLVATDNTWMDCSTLDHRLEKYCDTDYFNQRCSDGHKGIHYICIPQNAKQSIYPVLVKMLGLRFSSQAELI